LQVQYAFLELPKVPSRRPEGPGAGLWAWLFVHAPELTEVPADLSPGPYRDALELANQAKFSEEELAAYERVRDEIRQVLEIASARFVEGKALGKAEGIAEGKELGKAEGIAEGELKGKREALLFLLERLGIILTDADRARIAACGDRETLDRWFAASLGAKRVGEILR